MAGPCPLPFTLNINGKSITFKNSTEFKTWMSDQGLQELIDSNVIDMADYTGVRKAKAQVGPVPPAVVPFGQPSGPEETRNRRILERIIESSAIPEDIKEEFLQQGIDYVPKGLSLTKQEALAYVDVFKQANALDRLETLVKDSSSGFTEDVRSAVLAKLWDEYATQAKQETDPVKRQNLKDRAVSLGMYAAERATELGRGVNAQKIWSDLLGRHPELVVDAVQKTFDKWNKEKVDEYKDDSKAARNIFNKFTERIEANKNNKAELNKIEEEIKEQLFDKIKDLSVEQASELVDYMMEHYLKYNQMTAKSMDRLMARVLGLKYVTEEDAKNLEDLQRIINNSEDAAVTYLNNPTEANKKKYIQSVKDAQLAAKKLNKFFTPEKGFGSLIMSMIQGGLLNLRSVLLNVWYNISIMPLRFASNLNATAIDYLLSQVAKTRLVEYINDKLPNRYSKYKLSKDRTINILAAQKGYYAGLPMGLTEGIRQLRTGAMPDDVQNRELQNGLEIVDAWIAVYNKLSGKEKMRMGRLIVELTEGTFGIAPEVMFRLLNLGDKPFKRASERARLYEIAWFKKLEGIDLEKFLTVPDAETLKMIEQAGLEATFQNENLINDWIKKGKTNSKKWAPIGWIFTIMRATQSPYVRTPLNIIWETSTLVSPELAAVEGLLEIKAGNRRAAVKAFGKVLTGLTLRYVAGTLVAAGLVSATAADDDEKERAIKNEYDVPLYFNYTAFLRWMSGENPRVKKGDYKIALTSLGISGSLLAIHANIAKMEKEEKIDGQKLSYIEKLLYLLPVTAQNALEQSFLNNANTLLNAIKEGGASFDKWIAQSMVTLSSAFYPNTLASYSRSQDIYLRDVRGMSLDETVINTLKNRMFMGKDLPAKVSIWGERVPNVPDNKNAFVYYFFDIFKGKKSEVTKFGYPLYNIYKETGNTKVLPSPIGKEIEINGVKYKLTAEEQQDLAIEVGQARKNLVSDYILEMDDNVDYEEFDPNKRYAQVISNLQSMYKLGYQQGLEEWMLKSGKTEMYDMYNTYEAE
jgi:hypothetical protein